MGEPAQHARVRPATRHYDDAANLSLRTVFAVGPDDSAVMNLH